MTEKILEALGHYLPWFAAGLMGLAILAGIIQRIYARIRYGPSDDKRGPQIQPMQHYGAMPTSGTFQKPDFSYNEDEEQKLEEYEKKL